MQPYYFFDVKRAETKKSIMKKHILKLATLSALMIVIASGCKKELVKDVSQDRFEDEIEHAASIADADISPDDIVTDENSELFELESEGINPNYFVDETDFDEVEVEEGVAGSGKSVKAKRKRVAAKSFIHCLRKLDLEKRQVLKVKLLLGKYRDCKSSSVKRAKALYAKIRAPYIAKYKRLVYSYKNGKITKKELVKSVYGLRVDFAKDLRKAQIKEKLHVAFKNCYKKMLRELHGVLNAKQWTRFIACVK